MVVFSDESSNEDNEYILIVIESIDNLIEPTNNIINFYKHCKMYNYLFFACKYIDNNSFFKYCILKTDYINIFKEIKLSNSVIALLDDDIFDCSIIDDNFFDQLYRLENKGLKTSIAQLVIFPEDDYIINKCKERVETYVIPKVAIELIDICSIIPQYNINGFKIDCLFEIKTYNDKIPSICLEIDENNHNDRDKKYEKNREDIIKIFGHRLIRESIKRTASDDELIEHINNIVDRIRIQINDLTTEYSLSLTESDFIERMNSLASINNDFIRLFAKKDDERYGKFKYEHREIALFLGYEICENDGSSKRFIELIKKELKINEDYKIDDGTSDIYVRGANIIKKGVKLTYRLTRVAFYIICMVSIKPKAKIYRRQFGKVYELALEYTQNKKNNLISKLPNIKVSEKIIDKRINFKVEHKMKLKNNKNIKLIDSNQSTIDNLNTKIIELKETIEDLMEKNDNLMLEVENFKIINKSLQINNNFLKSLITKLSYININSIKHYFK